MNFLKYRLMTACFTLGFAALGAGCQSIDPIERPAVATPEDWPAQDLPLTDQEPAAVAISRDWWQSFESDTLARLIEQAFATSLDMTVARERVTQAELQMRMADASLFPSLNLSASSGESRSRFDGGDWSESQSSRVGLGMSYEVDLWGRVRAQTASAEADYLASQYDFEAARLSIAAAVASAWFDWLSLNERIARAEENIRIAERNFDVVQARYDNGSATAADISRQRSSVLNQQASLLPLQLQARQTRAAIAILIGQNPLGFTLPSEPIMALVPPVINAGVPAEVITRRPDLARAEADLQAADANVAAARRALLPSISLTASASRGADGLFSLSPPTDALGWSLGLAQTVFAGGRLKNQVKLTESQRRVLVEQYRNAILVALQEVNDALDRAATVAELEDTQRELVFEAERTLRLTEIRYKEGSAGLLDLLEAQRVLFQTQDQLAQQHQARLNAAVDLYKALGGGWQLSDSVSQAPAQAEGRPAGTAVE